MSGPPISGLMPEIQITECASDGDMGDIYRPIQISDPSFFKCVESTGDFAPLAMHPSVAARLFRSASEFVDNEHCRIHDPVSCGLKRQ